MAVLDASIFQKVSNEVIIDPYVLASVMENWILGQGQSRLVVHLQLHHIDFFAQQLPEQPGQPQCIAAEAVAMYSASQLDKATTFSLIGCQLIKQSPRKNIVPLVLLLVSTSPARSLLQ